MTTKKKKCMTAKRRFSHFVLPTGNLSDQLGKRGHKFTHKLHFQAYYIYQSCEPVVFISCNKFLHLIGPVLEQP